MLQRTYWQNSNRRDHRGQLTFFLQSSTHYSNIRSVCPVAIIIIPIIGPLKALRCRALNRSDCVRRVAFFVLVYGRPSVINSPADNDDILIAVLRPTILFLILMRRVVNNVELLKWIRAYRA